MSLSIKTNLPLNLSEYQQHFFDSLVEYTPSSFGVVEIKNVYITNSGIAFKLTGLVKKSVYNYSDRQRKYWLASLFNFFRKKKKKLLLLR